MIEKKTYTFKTKEDYLKKVKMIVEWSMNQLLAFVTFEDEKLLDVGMEKIVVCKVPINSDAIMGELFGATYLTYLRHINTHLPPRGVEIIDPSGKIWTPPNNKK